MWYAGSRFPAFFSYPVLQGEDNAYYLSHAWDGTENTAGSIFLDYRASPNLTDFHTLIYGHRMRDGSMFGSLRQYNDAEFWRQHPSVYLSNEDGIWRYDIFAAYEVGWRRSSTGRTFPRRTGKS